MWKVRKAPMWKQFCVEGGDSSYMEGEEGPVGIDPVWKVRKSLVWQVKKSLVWKVRKGSVGKMRNSLMWKVRNSPV